MTTVLYSLHLTLQEMGQAADALLALSEMESNKKCKARMANDAYAYRYHEKRERDFKEISQKFNRRIADVKDYQCLFGKPRIVNRIAKTGQERSND